MRSAEGIDPQPVEDRLYGGADASRIATEDGASLEGDPPQPDEMRPDAMGWDGVGRLGWGGAGMGWDGIERVGSDGIGMHGIGPCQHSVRRSGGVAMLRTRRCLRPLELVRWRAGS